MIYQATDMAQDVRVVMDMNHSSNTLLADGDTDTLQLDELVRSKLKDAARQVILEAPRNLLECGHSASKTVMHSFADSTTNIGTDGKGWLILPDDYLRLVMFRMSDWKRPVYLPINESDPLYQQQWSERKGLCGNPTRPVVAIVMRAEGKVLEFFSCKTTSATIDQAVYVPVPVIDSTDGIDIPDLLYRPAVYRAAALALVSIGDQNAANIMEISKGMLQ